MSCVRYHQLMSLYVDGEVTPRQRQELLQHVESCADCAAWLARLRQTDVLLKGVPEARPSDRVRSAVLRSVQQDADKPNKRTVSLARPKSNIRTGFMGLLLRFDPSPRRIALLIAVVVASLTTLGYYLNVLPLIWGYNELGFEVSGDSGVAQVNSEPLAAISSGYNGVGGAVAVPNPVRLLPSDTVGVGIAQNEPMRVRFDLPMDRASVERALIIDPPAAGAFSWDADNEMRFSAQGLGLLRGITYTVTISNSARSLQGIPLKTPVTWSFRTKEPYSVQPNLPSGSSVSVTSTFTLLFDTPMDKTDAAKSISLHLSPVTQNPGSKIQIKDVPVSLVWDVEGRKLTVSPMTPIEEGKVYLRVEAAARTQAGEEVGQASEFAYDVAMPTPRLRLLNGRVSVVAAGSPVPVRYEAVPSTMVGTPNFDVYHLPSERLSALSAQSRSWPGTLPSGFPSGDPLGGLNIATSTPEAAGQVTAQLSGLEAGTYLLVANAPVDTSTLSDWQLLIVADHTLRLPEQTGQFWATDEAGHAWANAKVSLYSFDGALLDKGLTSVYGLWAPLDKGLSASLAIAQDDNGHIAALLLDQDNSPSVAAQNRSGALAATLQTDLSEYQPGHLVHFRVLLHAAAKYSLSQPYSAITSTLQEQDVSVLLLNPGGSVIAALTLKPDSVGGVSGLFNLSPDLKPGTYTLRVRSGTPDLWQDFPIQVKSRPTPDDTLSVLIAPTPDISEEAGLITSTVSILGQVGEPAAGALLTATLGIDGDTWAGQPVTSTVGTDGRTTIVVPLPVWLHKDSDPGLYLRVEARRAELWGSDMQYLDLTSTGAAQSGARQLASPQLGVAVTSYPMSGGSIRMQVSSLLTDTSTSTTPLTGDLLISAQAPRGEHLIRYVHVDDGTAIMLPARFAGGVVSFFRAGVSGSRELALMPGQGGGLRLRLSAPQTITANATMPLDFDLMDAEDQPMSGRASVWLRRVSGGTEADSLQSWEPSIELQATTTTTSTLQAPNEPGLWYVMAEAATPDGGLARTWSVVNVTPGLTIQMPPAQSTVAGEPQSVWTVMFNPGDKTLTPRLEMLGNGSVTPLSGEQTIEIESGSWHSIGWRFVAQTPGASALVLSSPHDSSSLGTYTLRIKASRNPRTNATYSSGVINSERNVGVQVPSGLIANAIQLQVRASTSLLPALASIAGDLPAQTDSTGEGVAIAAARLSAQYSVASAYHQLDVQPPAGTELLSVERSLLIQQLYSAQHADGGWGALLDGSGPSSITSTAQVLLAMRRHDIASGSDPQPVLDKDVIKRGIAYLSSEVTHPVGEEATTSVLDVRARGFYILSLYAELEPQWARTFIVYASYSSQKRGQGLSRDGQAWLALALWNAGQQEDGLALLDRLLSTEPDIQQAVSAPWLESLVAASHRQIGVGSNRANSTYELAATKVAHALMAARQGAGWSNPSETADAIWALSRYAVQANDKPGTAAPALTLNGQVIQAPSQQNDPATISIVLTGDALHAGTSWLKLRASSSEQPLYYSLTLLATR